MVNYVKDTNNIFSNFFHELLFNMKPDTIRIIVYVNTYLTNNTDPFPLTYIYSRSVGFIGE